MFDYELLPPVKTKQVSVDGKRHYQLPSGLLVPSVTTVLSYKEKPELEAWKKKKGPVEAARISKAVTTKGTSFHKVCEDFLHGKEVDIKTYPMDIQWQFRPFKEKLIQNIKTVYGLEFFCYSEELRLAGTTDCICLWDGVLSIVDHKTSKRNKKEEWIEDYFLQSTAYAIMVEEIYKIKIPQIVILVTVEEEPLPQVFVKKKEDYVSKLLTRIAEYESANKKEAPANL